MKIVLKCQVFVTKKSGGGKKEEIPLNGGFPVKIFEKCYLL